MKTVGPLPIPFEFREVLDDEGSTSYVLRVPANIQSKNELLVALSTAGRFPSYFGRNWDSLRDCLRDCHWLEEKRIVIVHSDLPLRANPRECRIYLEVLRDAANDWSRSHAADAGPKPTLPDHDFEVVFPVSVKSAVSDSLNL